MAAGIAKVPSTLATRPRNLQSYDAYLRGRYFLDKGTKQDFERASAAFHEAIRLDPEDATPWVWLGGMYSDSGRNGWMNAAEAHAQALKAVERALVIDPNLAAAHWMMCEQQLRANFNLEAARAECSRAREFESDSLKGNGVESDLAFAMGDVDEAVRLAQKGVELNPLSPAELYGLVSGLIASNRIPEAERAARNLADLYPG
jgi:adenylate cyclase